MWRRDAVPEADIQGLSAATDYYAQRCRRSQRQQTYADGWSSSYLASGLSYSTGNGKLRLGQEFGLLLLAGQKRFSVEDDRVIPRMGRF